MLSYLQGVYGNVSTDGVVSRGGGRSTRFNFVSVVAVVVMNLGAVDTANLGVPRLPRSKGILYCIVDRQLRDTRTTKDDTMLLHSNMGDR